VASATLLKVIAVAEIAGGVVLAALVSRLVLGGTTLAWPIAFVFEAVVVAAILAGVTLWKGEPPGFVASCILQLLQIVRIVSLPLTFELLLGPGATLVEPTGGSPHLVLELRATLTLFLGRLPDGAQTDFGINFVPIVVLIVLLRLKAQSGQPWLRPRERRPPWDRAPNHRRVSDCSRCSVDYQFHGWTGTRDGQHALQHRGHRIWCGPSSAHPMERRRCVAVNAIQILAVGTTQWAYLVRSGVSCVAALTWGASNGLRFQFDVGSAINEALAPGVDGFVGINVTALALTLLLVNYRPDKPTPSPLERRLFPTERR